MSLPLATRKSVKLLPLGTPITFHHRAGVARHRRAWKRDPSYNSLEPPRGWIIHEGLYKSEPIPEGMGEIKGEAHMMGPAEDLVVLQKGDFMDTTSWRLADMFFNWPQVQHGHNYTGKYNKTVFVWPSKGSGVVMGMIRRSCGTSHAGYTSGYEYSEYEQGYHHTDMYVDLYVVKQRYEGTEFILCPLWGVVVQDA